MVFLLYTFTAPVTVSRDAQIPIPVSVQILGLSTWLHANTTNPRPAVYMHAYENVVTFVCTLCSALEGALNYQAHCIREV